MHSYNTYWLMLDIFMRVVNLKVNKQTLESIYECFIGTRI